MSHIHGDQLGRYRIGALIGKGGMGGFYRATETRLNRDVALKVLVNVFDERFTREARAIASLNHPEILDASLTILADSAGTGLIPDSTRLPPLGAADPAQLPSPCHTVSCPGTSEQREIPQSFSTRSRSV